MGWANCGEDSKGRPIGYAFEGTCDHPGCEAEIDRGLAFVCGGMHGEDESSCEGYFCSEHMTLVRDVHGRHIQVCEECARVLEDYYKENCIQCPDCGGSGFDGDTSLWCIRCDNEGTILPGTEMDPEEMEAARRARDAMVNLVARQREKEESQ